VVAFSAAVLAKAAAVVAAETKPALYAALAATSATTLSAKARLAVS